MVPVAVGGVSSPTQKRSNTEAMAFIILIRYVVSHKQV